MKTQSPKSLLMLISSMLVFGTIGIFRRFIPLPSAVIAFFRGMIGALFLILFLKFRGKKIRHGIGFRKGIWLALSGAIIGFNWIFLFEAYNYTSVSVATLCYYMQPVIVIILSVLIFHEKMTVRKAICSLIALCGMVLISGVMEGGLPGTGELRGILLGLAAAVLYSTVVLMNMKISGVDAYEKTIIQLGSAALVMIPYLLITGDFSGLSWNPETIGLLLFVAVVHTGICYTLYFGSISGLKTQTVALFSYIDPITALVLSALILHERMTGYGILGAVLILGSAIVSELAPEEKS